MALSTQFDGAVTLNGLVKKKSEEAVKYIVLKHAYPGY